MKLQELNSKAKVKAMEQVYKIMKDRPDQYREFDISVMYEYVIENDLTFDENGNLQ